MSALLGQPAMPLAGPEQVLLGRQPIVDRDGRMFAFELLFRGNLPSSAHDDLAATSEVLRHAFAELGVDKALGPYRGFVNCDDAMLLMADTLELLPSERVVIEILESVQPTPEVLARLRELKAAGFLLALDDYCGPRPDLTSLLGLVDYVKIDLPHIEHDRLDGIVADLRRFPAELVAEKVEFRAQAERTTRSVPITRSWSVSCRSCPRCSPSRSTKSCRRCVCPSR
jgi:c-di-GMP-related signal transduction protein